MNEIIVGAICQKCGKKYWSTEGYEALIRIGMEKPLCIHCEAIEEKEKRDVSRHT